VKPQCGIQERVKTQTEEQGTEIGELRRRSYKTHRGTEQSKATGNIERHTIVKTKEDEAEKRGRGGAGEVATYFKCPVVGSQQKVQNTQVDEGKEKKCGLYG